MQMIDNFIIFPADRGAELQIKEKKEISLRKKELCKDLKGLYESWNRKQALPESSVDDNKDITACPTLCPGNASLCLTNMCGACTGCVRYMCLKPAVERLKDAVWSSVIPKPNMQVTF